MKKTDGRAALEARLQEMESVAVKLSGALGDLEMELGHVCTLCREMVADVQEDPGAAQLWATIALVERMQKHADDARRLIDRAGRLPACHVGGDG